MGSCCDSAAEELELLRRRQGSVLRWVLAINAVMFVVEFGAGWLARSTALLGDSLDMLGDSLVYAFSLWVLRRGAAWRARAALSKGFVQLGFGVLVLAEAASKLGSDVVPVAGAMGGVGLLALAANVVCFVLLWAHRGDDVNLRSTWLCSRNDLVANAAVLVAAGLVALTGSVVPDVVVGAGIALLFLRTAASVLREGLDELDRAKEAASGEA